MNTEVSTLIDVVGNVIVLSEQWLFARRLVLCAFCMQDHESLTSGQYSFQFDEDDVLAQMNETMNLCCFAWHHPLVYIEFIC